MPEGGPAANRRFADLVTTADRRAAYIRDGLWDFSTLSGRVVDHARRSPGATAVIDQQGRHSRQELLDAAEGMAAWLTSAGIGEGSVVSVQLPNRFELVVTALATQSLGAVVNPLLPNYRARELSNVFSAARPAVVVTPATYREFDHRALVVEVGQATGIRPVHVVVDGEAGIDGLAMDDLMARPGPPLGTGRAEAVSELIFTSGTEARPKAIMHTEQTANFSVRVAHADLGVDADDVVWMPSPLGHSTGFNYGMRFALYHGLPLVLQDRWDPSTAIQLILSHGCSYTLAATTFLRDLVDEANRQGADLTSMRVFGCGGAPVPPPLVDAAERVGIDVLRLYGSTEVLVATWNRPGSAPDRRRHTDGVALTDVEVDVRDEEGRGQDPGQEGELYVRGPNTCVGFFEDPERTAATFGEDGWVRSGDIVTCDDAGYVTVVGRRKEIIIRGGLNIAPREIEEMLLEWPEVDQAAVVGLPDERLGETMCACVVPRPGATLDLETVVGRLRAAGLATYKLPQRLEMCDALPMTASGKVQKHLLVQGIERTPG